MFGQLFHFKDLVKELIKMALSETLQEEQHVLKQAVQEVLLENGWIAPQQKLKQQEYTNNSVQPEGTSQTIQQSKENPPSAGDEKINK